MQRKDFETSLLSKLFSAQSQEQQTALMYAAGHQTEAVASILKAMKSLPAEDIHRILSIKNAYGQNALLIAARFNPEALPAMIKTINTLPKKLKFDLLSTKDSAGQNLLLIAAQFQPQALPVIIEDAMHTFTPSQNSQIASTKDPFSGLDAVSLLIKHHPSAREGLRSLLAVNEQSLTQRQNGTTPAINKFKEFKIDLSKNKILAEFSKKIDACTTPEALAQFKTGLKDNKAYKILATNQNRISGFLNLKTTSVDRLEKLIQSKEQELESLSNARPPRPRH